MKKHIIFIGFLVFISMVSCTNGAPPENTETNVMANAIQVLLENDKA